MTGRLDNCSHGRARVRFAAVPPSPWHWHCTASCTARLRAAAARAASLRLAGTSKQVESGLGIIWNLGTQVIIAGTEPARDSGDLHWQRRGAAAAGPALGPGRAEFAAAAGTVRVTVTVIPGHK